MTQAVKPQALKPHALKPKVKAFLEKDSETFSYVVYDQVGGHGVIIDSVLNFDYAAGRTSTELAQQQLDFVREQKLTIDWVLETHAHADHLSAAPFLRDQLNAKIGIGDQITQVQSIFREVFALEPEFNADGSQFDGLFADEQQFSVGQLQIRVLHSPGHTPADLAYLVNEQALFVGDTLFMPDVGTARCDFPGGSSQQLYQSIKRLLALPAGTEIYVCHDYPKDDRQHEYRTTVAKQKAENIHVHDGIDEQSFVAMRDKRDATLGMPRLILPAIQVNIRAGEMPPADVQGNTFLKIPINKL
ncbi:MBL fold metallo-hydrolase [Oceanisphaera profunda]|uniref:MBL fold metallo-hydrolase n=1 Tax=Oceanisphaera profunda TaxID=1416627 RepID=A0A1Y0D4Y6_9GAMM|nr:MBL fold metallo-hydrolase [Oceanisphaera profunda]ART82601.1 MBL fold metallo-hydrolase [Oceanisphaera profunda]